MSNGMKILMIAPTPFFANRGGHIRIMEEARALKKLGHEIILVTYPIGENASGIDIRRTFKVPFYNRTEIGSSGKLLFDAKYILDLFLFFKVIKELIYEKPDVIYGHLHEGCLIGYFAKLFILRPKIPLIFDVQGSLTGELISYGFIRKRGIGYRVFGALEWIIDRMPDFLVFSSEASCDYALYEVGINKGKTRVVMDGFSSRLLNDEASVNDIKALKETYGINSDDKVVLYTGGLTRDKGIDYLIRAVPQVLAENENVKFLILGQPGIKETKKKLSDLGVSEERAFVGDVYYSELNKHFAIADIGIDPKLEGSKEASGKILNYMGGALPVVCFDTVNNRNLLGSRGVYAKSRSVKDLARKILNTLNWSDEELSDTGNFLRKRVIDKFSWDSVARDLDRIFVKLKNYE